MKLPLTDGDEVDGRYRIVRHLAVGGMGHVYEAEDHCLGRRVVLKVLHTGMQSIASARKRLEREGRAAAQVRHPGVVQIYEVGSDGRTDYVAMELLTGEDLQTRMQREGPLPIPFVLELGISLLDALAAMHAEGIVHRDLKPSNLFLSHGTRARVELKVLDFGVARVEHLEERLTDSGQVLGTLCYMPPEQLRGAKYADCRSDIWAVGAILYEALTGRRAFDAETGPELVLKIVSETPIPVHTYRNDVPSSLSCAVARALQRNPAQRHQTATEMLQALEKSAAPSAPLGVGVTHPLAAQGAAPTRTSQLTSTMRPWLKRTTLSWPVSLASLVVLGLWVALSHPGPEANRNRSAPREALHRMLAESGPTVRSRVRPTSETTQAGQPIDLPVSMLLSSVALLARDATTAQPDAAIGCLTGPKPSSHDRARNATGTLAVPRGGSHGPNTARRRAATVAPAIAPSRAGSLKREDFAGQ